MSALASRLLAVFLLAASPLAAGRLDGVVVERLPNGLTVMVLEDPTLPIVSTQVLYKVGGRNECTGATGLAHFVEHMAFRASERFPDTDVVSRIYAVGGEWHGYTWIDQTTYFETVPREHLPLVLDIQADRMSRLLLPAAELEAERGAVLTELHGYENDPASVLHDAVAAASFLEHPYRQNVIGWTSDVKGITHGDVAAFYRRHYNPANAVLAIAGDVKAAEALELARRAFGGIPGGEATPLPRTEEPPQQGERRVRSRLPRLPPDPGAPHGLVRSQLPPGRRSLPHPARLAPARCGRGDRLRLRSDRPALPLHSAGEHEGFAGRG
jgi:zinc protease